MRGRWDEAVDNCMAALRLAPQNASAQSLLGDIYENQGRLDDAIQWYRMALDVSPDSPADQLKLDRLLNAKQRVPARRRTRTATGRCLAPITIPRPRRRRQRPLSRQALSRSGPAAALGGLAAGAARPAGGRPDRPSDGWGAQGPGQIGGEGADRWSCPSQSASAPAQDRPLRRRRSL